MENLQVQCPFCFEWNEVPVEDDPPYDTIIDCAICCHPLERHVRMGTDGEFTATADKSSGFD